MQQVMNLLPQETVETNRISGLWKGLEKFMNSRSMAVTDNKKGFAF